MRAVYGIFLFLIGLPAVSAAQLPVFKNGDRVSFVGNSITMSGSYHNYIELYYLTRFPNDEVRIYNNGISGDVTEGMLRRMRADVLVNKPDWCVLMAGMNDVNRSLYAKVPRDDQGIQQRRQEALETYFKNMDSMVNLLMHAGVKVVLQTPTIYDQTADIPSDNYRGVNDALEQCALYIKSLGKKYSLPVVDYWSSMNAINTAVQKINPSASIIGRDRVHPGMYGYFLMLTEFLKSQQVPPYVAMVAIDAKKGKIEQSVQGDAVLLNSSSKGLSFEWKEDALPFPLLSAGFKPDSLFSFSPGFNNEMLQVKALKKGKYVVYIDAVEVGQYSGTDLNEGINLSLNSRTPQHIQAAKVLQLLQEYWKIERKLRQVRYVDYQLLPIGARRDPAFFDVNLKRRTDKIIELFKDKPEAEIRFYRRNLDEYIVNKPRAKELQDEAEEKYKEIQQANKPVKHVYTIASVK